MNIDRFIKSKYLKLTVLNALYFRYYLKTRRFLSKTKNDKPEEIEKNQIIKIRDLLIHSYKNVPYYTELFTKEKIDPQKFNALSDIKHIPYLTKELIMSNFDKLISTSTPSKYLKKIYSGGTTGMPIEFCHDYRYSSPVEMAYLQYFWGRVGFRLFDRCIVMRGEALSIVEGSKYWKMNYSINWLSMSSFHLTDATFRLYAEKIASFNPKFIIAYPSVAFALARLYEKYAVKTPESLKAIIYSSENVFEEQRNYVEKIFNARTFAYYGLSEKCCLAAEGVNDRNYEFAPYYGFVELINKNNEWCSAKNERGEIVATSFYNYAFPFIRYKTKDIGVYHIPDESKNNGWFKIERIEGRQQDYIIDKKNNIITFTCHDEPFYALINKLSAYQFHQSKPGEIKVLLESHIKLTPGEIEELNRVLSFYYQDFDMHYEETPHIERTKSGKFRYLIQNLPINFYSNA